MPDPLVHLSLTGPAAGTPYCGAPRGADRYVHLPYTNNPTGFVTVHVTCPDCRRVYFEER